TPSHSELETDMDRKALFDAVRPFAPGGRLKADWVPMIDALADAFGLPSVANGGVQTDLTDQDFADAATALGCSVAQIRAVFEVEASGAGWFTDMRGEI